MTTTPLPLADVTARARYLARVAAMTALEDHEFASLDSAELGPLVLVIPLVTRVVTATKGPH